MGVRKEEIAPDDYFGQLLEGFGEARFAALLVDIVGSFVHGAGADVAVPADDCASLTFRRR